MPSPSPFRVAHLMAGARMGGAELFFERLCLALHGAGDAVLPVIRADPGRAARLAAEGLPAEPASFRGWADLPGRLCLRRLLRRFAPRVAVAWMSRAASMAPRGDWALVGRLGGYYDLGAFRRCDHLVGNTRTLTAQIVAQGWPADRAHHLPNFSPDCGGATPDRFGAPAGPLLMSGGRLHRNKGFDVLIRALRRLPRAHLVIAGEGPERAALRDLARTEGVADRLSLPGWIADPRPLLAACDVYVCSSRREVLGNVVLEAWSAGKPVAAAAADGPAELIAPGWTGLLAPVEDDAALAGAIGALLEDRTLAARLGAAGRARWERDFAPAPVLAAWRGFLAAVEPA